MENGPVLVNGKPMEEIFGWDSWKTLINEPFNITNTNGQFRVVAKITGGGVVSQAGALRHGISRALIVADPNLPKDYKIVYHLYIVFANNRDKLLNYCLKNGIEAKVHYPIPIYRQEALSY